MKSSINPTDNRIYKNCSLILDNYGENLNNRIKEYKDEKWNISGIYDLETLKVLEDDLVSSYSGLAISYETQLVYLKHFSVVIHSSLYGLRDYQVGYTTWITELENLTQALINKSLDSEYNLLNKGVDIDLNIESLLEENNDVEIRYY